MDRSQLRKIGIWFISLCLSISPFWSVSQTTERSADSLETAFDALEENVQDELVFKRLMIEAIDTSLEINSALGFDSSNNFHKAVVLVPAYAVIRGTYFAQKGLLSDIRRITPEKRKTTKGAFKESRKLIRTLLDKEQALKNAENRLTQLRVQAAEEIISIDPPKPLRPLYVDPSTAPVEQTAIAAQQTPNKAVLSNELMNKPISISNNVSPIKAQQIRTTLSNNGIVSFGDLVQKTPAELSSLGLDNQSMDAINHELDKKGLTLASEADNTAVAQTEKGKAPAADKPATAQTEKGKAPAAADADKPATAQTEKGKAPAADTDKPAQAEGKTKSSFAERARAERTQRQQRGAVQTEQGHIAPADKPAQTAERGAIQSTPENSSNKAALQKMVANQEKIVSNLQNEVDIVKTDIKKIMNIKLKNIFYRGGRFIRNIGFLAVGLAGIPVYIAAVGETVIVVFDLPEDMEFLREQYVQDIEEVITSVSR